MLIHPLTMMYPILMKGGEAPGVSNISAKLLQAGGPAMINGLHVVLTVWQSGTIPPVWKKRDWSLLSGKRKGAIRTEESRDKGATVKSQFWQCCPFTYGYLNCNTYSSATLFSVPGKVLPHLLLFLLSGLYSETKCCEV